MRWFAPLLLFATLLCAQGQDRWERMSRRDTDGDGKISREEWTGPSQFFDRMDGDGDGFVTKEEVNAMGGRRRGRGGGGQALRQFDGNSDGRVTKEEFDAFFKKADGNGDGILDREEMSAALGGRRYNDTAPKVGAALPAVKAKDAKTGAVVDLGQVRRPTVLVFGSWT